MSELELDPDTRYDMPVVFGPSVVPATSAGHASWTANVRFVTTRDAAATLLGPWFEPADVPVVTVSYGQLLNLDWLHGRSYNLTAVMVNAVCTADEPIEAPFVVVIWETDTNPIISGRELLGSPKLFGQIADADVGASTFSFDCREYGTQLFEAHLGDMTPVDDAGLAKLNAQAAEYVRFFWKYIPGLSGVPDANYPTLFYQSAVFDAAWSGTGDVEFRLPTPQQAPFGSRVVHRLSTLPVLERLASSAGHASSMLMLRSKTRRLA